MAQEDYYRVLQIPRGVPATEIRKAYWSLAHHYRERMHTDPVAARLMDRLNEAYRVLATPDLRHSYDLELDITTPAPDPKRPRPSWLRWWGKHPSL